MAFTELRLERVGRLSAHCEDNSRINAPGPKPTFAMCECCAAAFSEAVV